MGAITIECLSKFNNKNTFIETGSYLGDAIQTALDFGFKNIHSIELKKEFFENCVERYKNFKNVKLWQGESSDCITEIIKNENNQIVFWLDAHASGPVPGGRYGGSPLIQELQAIGEHHIKNHIIIIDDVRLFGSEEWSGLQKEQVIDSILNINYKYRITYIDGHIPGDIMIARVI
jgi:hypothetical protein